jgi:hypothetical protein
MSDHLGFAPQPGKDNRHADASTEILEGDHQAWDGVSLLAVPETKPSPRRRDDPRATVALDGGQRNGLIA